MKSFCFQLNRRSILTLLMAVMFALPAFSQQITVQGTVIDENGEPVIGASVVDQGTKAGTATDFDGKFVLNVDSNATLTVSYVGYQPLPLRSMVNLTLQSSCHRAAWFFKKS